MRRTLLRVGVASALAVVALGTAECGGGQPVARAYDSKELEPLRDSTITLDPGYSGGGVVAYSTGGGLLTPTAWWTVDLTTGAVQSYGSNVPSSALPPFTCIQGSEAGDTSGTFTMEIFDSTTNAETDIHKVVSEADCPGADRMLTALVLDDSGGIVLARGPFDQLTQVPLPVDVQSVVAWGSAADAAPVSGTPTSLTVLAASASSPGQEEVDTIDLATLAVTVAVPAVPASVAWAAGATPVGSLQSTTVVGSTGLIQPVDGHYVYPRAMSDGGATIFAGPLAAGPASELALFELPTGTPLPLPSILGPAGDILSPRSLVTWQLDGSAGAASQLIVWDDTDLVVTSCPSIPGAFLAGTWSPDHSKQLFSAQVAQYYGSAGPLDLWTAGAVGGTASCQQLVGNGVLETGFSPDGDFMYWVVLPPSGEAQLWIAADDGTGARMIGSGEINDAHFIGDGGARLEMILGGELVWLDLHDASGTLHHVAEQVHGAIYDITGGHWLIMGYEWSTTDGTGTLAVINRDDGSVRPISQSVAQYEVLIGGQGPDGGLVPTSGDAAVGIEYVAVYVVRGRNPSPQDGIWRAIITPAELQ